VIEHATVGIGNHETIPPKTREEFVLTFADWLNAPAIRFSISIQFLGLESHGLDVNAVNQVTPANLQHSRESQWELYKVSAFPDMAVGSAHASINDAKISRN